MSKVNPLIPARRKPLAGVPNHLLLLIKAFPTVLWDPKGIVSNPNFNMDIVLIDPRVYEERDWSFISASVYITFNDIIKNPDLPWIWSCVSMNPNITFEDIKNNPNLPWDWTGISNNLNITPEIIQNNPDLPWNWQTLCVNPNITATLIRNNSFKPWDWNHMSFNVSITDYRLLIKV